jgi:DNA-directed RNA polymerase I, II, and III subunit RPABC2
MSDYEDEYLSDNNTDIESESEDEAQPIITIKKNVNVGTIDDEEEVIKEEDDEDSDGEYGASADEGTDDDDDVDDVDDVDVDDDDISSIENDTINKKKTDSNKPIVLHGQNGQNGGDETDEEDDDDDDVNYYKKFEQDVNTNYINNFHPECISHNYEEISALSQVVRNSDNIILDPLHKTIPYLTKYERTRVLGQRSKQIESGSRPFIKIPENIIDSYVIAEMELQEKKIPFIIRRPFPGGGCEYWNLKDLEMISF